jgi:hypothetical protein
MGLDGHDPDFADLAPRGMTGDETDDEAASGDDEDRPMTAERDPLRDWHRLFGLLLTDFFTDSPFRVESSATCPSSSNSSTW